MAPLHTWSFRDVLAYALGWAVPMLVMYFGAPALQEYLEQRGVDVGDAWRFQWWLGIVPYPVPFTTRAGLAIALILVPPIAFVFVWWIARRRAPKLFFTPRSR